MEDDALPTVKRCRACGETKLASDFSKHPNTRDRLSSSCKSCDSARHQARARAIRGADKAVPKVKKCPKCGQFKPGEEFGRNRSRLDGLSWACRECSRAMEAEDRRRNPERAEKNRARLAAMYAGDHDRYLNYSYTSRFGITLAEYEALLQKQGGRCAICGTKPNGERLAVDHDHACCPGKRSCGKCVRGLLCGHCNRGLGHFNDREALLARALAYLSRWAPS